jgi:tetratricopeptide (TPR) repeat protein
LENYSEAAEGTKTCLSYFTTIEPRNLLLPLQATLIAKCYWILVTTAKQLHQFDQIGENYKGYLRFTTDELNRTFGLIHYGMHLEEASQYEEAYEALKKGSKSIKENFLSCESTNEEATSLYQHALFCLQSTILHLSLDSPRSQELEMYEFYLSHVSQPFFLKCKSSSMVTRKEKILQLTVLFLGRKKYQKALAYLTPHTESFLLQKGIVTMSKEDFTLFQLAAIAHLQQGNFQKALSHFDLCIKMQNLTHHYVGRCLAYLHLKEDKKAEMDLATILQEASPYELIYLLFSLDKTHEVIEQQIKIKIPTLDSLNLQNQQILKAIFVRNPTIPLFLSQAIIDFLECRTIKALENLDEYLKLEAHQRDMIALVLQKTILLNKKSQQAKFQRLRHRK